MPWRHALPANPFIKKADCSPRETTKKVIPGETNPIKNPFPDKKASPAHTGYFRVKISDRLSLHYQG